MEREPSNRAHWARVHLIRALKYQAEAAARGAGAHWHEACL